MASSNRTSCYCYSFHVYESPVRDWGEDDDGPGGFTTVKTRLWKSRGPSSLAIELVGGTECGVHLGEVVAENDPPIINMSSCLGFNGVPEVCHAKMIAKIMEYINAQVIMNRRYESETVLMDIVEDSSGVVNISAIEEALRWSSDSDDDEVRVSGRRWFVMDMTVGGSLAWPVDAEGNIAQAVGVLRQVERLEEAARRAMARMEQGEAVIARLSKVEQGNEVALECVICMEEDDLGFTQIPHCKHVFHTKCLETWLSKSTSCPLCRYKFV